MKMKFLILMSIFLSACVSVDKQIQYARLYDNPDMLFRLFSEDKEQSINRYCTFYWAVEKDYTRIVKLMVKQGISIKKAERICTDEHDPPVLIEAVKNGNVEIVKILMENGADVNIKHSNGTTPLIEAAGDGSVEIIKILIENGASVNAIRSDGTTPLFNAIAHHHNNIARIIIENGADLNTFSYRQGDTPLIKVLKQANSMLIVMGGGTSPESRKQLVALMLEKGVDINAKNKKGKTALDYSVRTLKKTMKGGGIERIEEINLLPGVYEMLIEAGERQKNRSSGSPSKILVIDNVLEGKQSYTKAFELVKEKKYDDAITQFRSFLDRYPNSIYSDNATFWLGNSYLAIQRYSEAVTEFNNLLNAYPDSDKVDSTYFNLGIAQYRLGMVEEAIYAFEMVRMLYPNSPYAKIAKIKLEKM